MSDITLYKRTFRVFLTEQTVRNRIKTLADEIRHDHAGNDPLFIAVLNGSFIFAADLFREMDFPCSISFVKVASYAGTETTGKVSETIGLSEDIAGRHIIIIEDIIDSGLTMQYLLAQLQARNPASIQVAALLFKRERLKVPIDPEYIGFEVPDKFLVGYGLDYDGYGRNFRHIYAEA